MTVHFPNPNFLPEKSKMSNRLHTTSMAGVVGLLVLVFSVGTARPCGDVFPTDAAQVLDAETMALQAKRLQGDWYLSASVRDGRKREAKELATDYRYRFLRGTLTMCLVGEYTDPIDFRLDLTRSPAAMDLIHADDNVLRGIYRIDGDTLTLCWNAEPGGVRPVDFTAKSGSNRRLVFLKRAPRKPGEK